ncbi:MAG TPA: filamentous hemagglutinin N-terminal domain-containing protein [Chlamydiales bacterium]|nr:filamentous hemagglutinin N-terminal domain-containing protein [Chlamydiales bacterium]
MRYLALVVIFCTQIFANPQNPEVISGKVEFEEIANTLSVHTDEKAIIDWESFSISENEKTSFIQPSSESIVLNRVLGEIGSEILGGLESNGYLFLINPMGILIGKEARVDVGGLVASTLDIQNSDFDEQTWHFYGPSEESVLNLGNIETTGGHICLVGKKVENQGVMNANGGSASMIGTSEVMIQLNEGSPIFYRVWTSDMEEQDSLSAIKVEDDSFELFEEDGEVFVVGPSDVINKGVVQSAGGKIYLLGDQIDLQEESLLDVSDSGDAGSVFVGGFQGHYYEDFGNLGIVTDPNAQILAHSTDDGNGGKVILLSQGGNSFNGLVYARGGPNGGNGGVVQIAGLEKLNFLGNVDIFAPNGYMGSLFISPFINIK